MKMNERKEITRFDSHALGLAFKDAAFPPSAHWFCQKTPPHPPPRAGQARTAPAGERRPVREQEPGAVPLLPGREPGVCFCSPGPVFNFSSAIHYPPFRESCTIWGLNFCNYFLPPFLYPRKKAARFFMPDGFLRNVIDQILFFSVCRLWKALYLQCS